LYILDTDHVSLWLENHPGVRTKTAEFEADLAITIITVQELFNGWIGRLNDPGQSDRQIKLYAKLSMVVAYLQEVRVLELDKTADDCFRRLLTEYPKLRKNRLQKDMGIVAIIWASRTQSLERMSWAIVTWIFLLISWVWFGALERHY
jgi:tRNA(fMet)-specific endonuclease VapC